MTTGCEYRVWATGSADAADQAKRLARSEGYHIGTVASIRL